MINVNDSSETKDESIVIDDLSEKNDEAIKGGPLFEPQLSGQGKKATIHLLQ